MRKWFLVMLVAGLVSTAWADTVGGTVSVPLADFLKLQSPTATGPTAAPRPFVFAGATYRVVPKGDWVRVEAETSLDVRESGWLEIPMLATQAVLSSTTLGGKAVPVYQKNGIFHLLTRGVGRHQLKVVYQLPLSTSGKRKTFNLRTLESPLCRVKLVLPSSGLKVSSSPAAMVVEKKAGGQFLTLLSLPGGTNNSAQISWEPKAKPRDGQRPARLRGEVRTVARVSERAVRCTSRINYSISGGEVELLRLSVPVDVEVLEAECAGIAGWNVAERNGTRQVNVALSRPVSGSLELKVVYEKPISDVNSAWKLPALNALGVRGVKGWVAVVCAGSIEVMTSELEEARAIETGELPRELSQSGTVLVAAKYSSQPYGITLETRKGEELAVLTTAVDQAQGRTLVTSDGKVVSSFTYQVRNNHKQYLELKLPPETSIWSVFVNGAPVKPVETESGRVKLPLVSSVSGQAFPVELTCVRQVAPVKLVGQQTLLAPELDVPISRFDWQVSMPDGREVVSFSGDMQPLESAPSVSAPGRSRAGWARGGGKSKDKAVARRPQRKNKKEQRARLEVASEVQVDMNSPAVDSADLGQVAGEGGFASGVMDNKMMNMVTTTAQGSFPVRVAVPNNSGEIFNFQKLMVTSEMPEIRFTYFEPRLPNWAGWAVLLLVSGLGFGLARRSGGWKVGTVVTAGWLMLWLWFEPGLWEPVLASLGWSGMVLLSAWIAYRNQEVTA